MKREISKKSEVWTLDSQKLKKLTHLWIHSFVSSEAALQEIQQIHEICTLMVKVEQIKEEYRKASTIT